MSRSEDARSLPEPGETVLITDAPVSYEQQLAERKRRYIITMALRFPCLILAGLFYQIPWLAVSLLVLSIPLPWIAVLIANDGPVRETKRRRPLAGTISYDNAIAPARPAADAARVIDAEPDQPTT